MSSGGGNGACIPHAPLDLPVLRVKGITVNYRLATFQNKLLFYCKLFRCGSRIWSRGPQHLTLKIVGIAKQSCASKISP